MESEASRAGRVEIDTSPPIESVKEAVTRFGGLGFWKPSLSKLQMHDVEVGDIAKMEEEARELEKDLAVKERETLVVLKELDSTKKDLDELNSELRNRTLELNARLESNVWTDSNKENDDTRIHHNVQGDLKSFPPLILKELQQAKVNLFKTTYDLANIQSSVESLNRKLEKEKASLETTRERVTLNCSKISYLEEELNQTKLKLQLAQYAEVKESCDNPLQIPKELQRLSCEAEQFKKSGENARVEASRARSQIELTAAKIRTAETKLIAARKMKEAAIACETIAIADIKALSNNCLQNTESVTLSYKEYSSLISKVQDSEDISNKRVINAMLQVNEANVSKMKLLKRVEEATEEVKTRKKVLEETFCRVEAANREKLAVEEALRKWRSDNGQKRRSLQNFTKFKNSCYPTQYRRESRVLDTNGSTTPVLKATLSIGEILSKKLLRPEEFEKQKVTTRSMSLGQMLGKQNGEMQPLKKASDRKRKKKYGFARFSLLLRKQSKKKPTPDLR